ncbi:MAG: hypothetical protein Q8Q09_26715 [Deltaproteobacteria bacterium]|nr:hypothetical protein [Deltaproteobacteria bacterium]
MAQGHGYVAGPGLERVESASSLLFALLASLSRVTPWSAAHLAQALSVLFAMLSLAMVSALPWATRRRPPRALDTLPAALAALLPTVHSAALDASESSLLALCLVAALAYHGRESLRPQRFPWSSVWLALAVATRFEALVAIPLFALARVQRAPARPRRQDLWWAVTLGALLGALTLFRLAYFAWPFPRWLSAELLAWPAHLHQFWGTLWRLALAHPPLALTALALSLASLSDASTPRSTRSGYVAALLSSLALAALMRDPPAIFPVVISTIVIASDGLRAGLRAIATRAPRSARPALVPVMATFATLATLALGARTEPLAITPRHAPSPACALALEPLRALDFARDAVGWDLRSTQTQPAPWPSLQTYTPRTLGRIPQSPQALERDAWVHSTDPRDPVFLLADRVQDQTTLASHRWVTLTQLRDPCGYDVAVDRDALMAPRISSETLQPTRAAPSCITLAGYQISQRTLDPTDALTVTLHVQALTPTCAAQLVLEGTAAAQTQTQRQPITPIAALTPSHGETLALSYRLEVPPGSYALRIEAQDQPSISLGQIQSMVRSAEHRRALRMREVSLALERSRDRDLWELSHALARVPSQRALRDPIAHRLALRAQRVLRAGAPRLGASMAEYAAQMSHDAATARVLNEIAERLADLARDAEERDAWALAFELAHRAVTLDPRRSWSRRRAEHLRETHPDSLRAWSAARTDALRQARVAMASEDPLARDESLVRLGQTQQHTQALAFASSVSHVAGDPRARIVLARALLCEGRLREALMLANTVACSDARDVELTRALRTLMGERAFRPHDARCLAE